MCTLIVNDQNTRGSPRLTTNSDGHTESSLECLVVTDKNLKTREQILVSNRWQPGQDLSFRPKSRTRCLLFSLSSALHYVFLSLTNLLNFPNPDV